MEIDNELLIKFADLASHVYKHLDFIPVTQETKGRTLSFPISEKQIAVLSEEGYDKWFFQMGRTLFEIPSILELWSEKGINDLLVDFVREIATLKTGNDKENSKSPDVTELTKIWLENINIEFDENECFLAVIGLVVEEPLTIGPLTYWPLKEKMEELKSLSPLLSSSFENLSIHNTSIASAEIAAENLKSSELLRATVEESLHILRYLGTLIWWDQPPHHIYTSGREISRVSYTLIMGNKEIVASVGESAYSISPFKLDRDILGLAEVYGLNFFSSLLTSQNITELGKSLITAIRWYSDGIQDLSPTYALLKYYVAIESLIKQEKEKAAKVLPKRLPYLLSQGYPNKYKKQKKEIRKLIEERNHVFHSGNPKELKIEFLAWQSSLLARNAINNLRMLLETHKMQTKQDLANWVDEMEKRHIDRVSIKK